MKKMAASLAVFAALALTAISAVADRHEGHESTAPSSAVKSGVFKDPVCGMDVSSKGAKYMCEYRKKKYYFCSKDEMETFKKDPAKYVGTKKK